MRSKESMKLFVIIFLISSIHLFSQIVTNNTEFYFEGKLEKVEYLTVSNKNYIQRIDYDNVYFDVLTTIEHQWNIYDNCRDYVFILTCKRRYCRLYYGPIIYGALFNRADYVLRERIKTNK